MPGVYDRCVSMLLGDEPRQRLRSARTATAAGLYGLCLLVQWIAVLFGLAEARDAIRLIAFCLTGALGFFLVIRSGLVLRFATPATDAALTTPQIVFAIVSVAFAYHVDAAFRGTMPMIVGLVLVHGAFILPPRRCLWLGLFAVAVFGVTIAFGARTDPVRFPALIEVFHFTFTVFVLLSLALLSGQLSALRASERTGKHELRLLMEQMRALATRDDLTGLPNRRYVQEWMPHEIARLRRNGGSLCLAMIDLDFFKHVNDRFGHAVGDQVLCRFATAVQAVLREGDVIARWGGEEFLLVMPDAHLAESASAIERARVRLATTAAEDGHSDWRVTFSAGLAQLAAGESLEQAVRRADLALYDAKAQGRDRMRIAAGCEGAPPAPAVAVSRA